MCVKDRWSRVSSADPIKSLPVVAEELCGPPRPPQLLKDSD